MLLRTILIINENDYQLQELILKNKVLFMGLVRI